MSEGGTWISFEIPWSETAVRSCPVCGRLITRRAWEFAEPEGTLRVCAPDCQELYESYYRPTHGRLQPGSFV